MKTVGDRTAQFLDPLTRRRREIVTPEGVLLRVELAQYGERAIAFLLDVLFLWAADVVLFVVLMLSGLRFLNVFVLFELALFVFFLLRNLYFIAFELSWQGMTPGKRILGVRVIDRRGGPLLPAAVIARNLMRELEIFMPLQAVLSAASIGPGAWGRLALTAWLLLLGLLPLFNKDRLRAGDLLAGTAVITAPKRRLLGDLVEQGASQDFTTQHLAAYGAFELQVLEELLRRSDSAETQAMHRDVCQRICRKIGWEAPVPPEECSAFLRRFYAAQRNHLEREQLYGRPRLEKVAAGGPKQPREEA